MADDFDPYYTWLGIPPDEQPADHYRLLGVRPLEDNRDVIVNAMDQRMHFLRTLQVGKRQKVSQNLLNEISAAAGCLLDPPRKAEYDRQLRGELQRRQLPSAAPASIAIAPATLPSAAKPKAARSGANVVTLLAAGAGFCLAVLGFVVLSMMRSPPAPQPPVPKPPIGGNTIVKVPPAVVQKIEEPEKKPAIEVEPPVVSHPPVPQADPAIDLLATDKSEWHVIRGRMTRDGRDLLTPSESTAIVIPVKFPAEYALEADLVREEGTNAVCFGFRVQGRPLTAVIDGFFSTKSGLASVGGQEIFTEGNPLVKPGALLTVGRPAKIRIEVTQQVVQLTVDGQTISRWQNDPSTPLRSAKGMSWGKDEAVLVFTWDAPYRFTRLVLVPLGDR